MNTNDHRFSRRSILAAGATGLIFLPARSALGFAANERINLAVLGHMYNAAHFWSGIHIYDNVEIVALCDPDQRELPRAFAAFGEQAKKLNESQRPEDKKAVARYQQMLENKPKTFSDFRVMFEQMGKGIDAMVVSLFDFYHAPACAWAMRLGKHVFSERPLGLKIAESRMLRELAAKQKVATSIRNPGNASGQFRRALELIREGAIGEVKQAHVWFDRGGPDLQEPPKGEEPVPDGLNWDAWLGPLAMRPFHSTWMSYAQWRENCNGGIGTFGPHAANLAFMSLNIAELWKQGKLKVRAECSKINRLSFPRWERIRWEVPARGGLPPVTFTWHNGPGHAPGAKDLLQKIMMDHGATQQEATKLMGYAGAVIMGSKGIAVADDHNANVTMLPKEKFEKLVSPKTIAPSHGHYNDWIIAIRGGPPAMANFEYANPLSEFLMLGNIATQFDTELEYDCAGMKITNHAEAEGQMRYEWRKGWEL